VNVNGESKIGNVGKLAGGGSSTTIRKSSALADPITPQAKAMANRQRIIRIRILLEKGDLNEKQLH
jgi:hypothetical protein